MTGDVPRIAVFMCVWKRLHLLRRMLDQLTQQHGVAVDFHILNNNPAIRSQLADIVAPYQRSLRIRMRHSSKNVGSFGRFVYAKDAGRHYPFVIFVDDDQEFDEDFLQRLWDEKIVGGVCSAYAYRFIRNDDYWKRIAPESGDRVEYCGPGGMILDSRVLASPWLYRGPPEGWMMDDIWLSYVFHHRLRLPMTKCSAPVRMTDRANDTWLTIRDEKSRFMMELRREGWRV